MKLFTNIMIMKPNTNHGMGADTFDEPSARARMVTTRSIIIGASRTTRASFEIIPN
ncbi:hypothetical protein D9M70_645790 [compost metagenome]